MIYSGKKGARGKGKRYSPELASTQAFATEVDDSSTTNTPIDLACATSYALFCGRSSIQTRRGVWSGGPPGVMMVKDGSMAGGFCSERLSIYFVPFASEGRSRISS